jgi:hypothetical protein
MRVPSFSNGAIDHDPVKPFPVLLLVAKMIDRNNISYII